MLGISLTYVAFSQSPFGASSELNGALETVRGVQPDVMVVFPEGATMANRISLANFAIAQRLPLMFGWPSMPWRGVDELRSKSARCARTDCQLRGQDSQGRETR
jgi:hypothetical protein